MSGGVIIATGWALTALAGWDAVTQDVATGVGTTIGLVGVIVALERRVEERARRVERRLDDVAEQLTAPAIDTRDLLPREAILSEYRQRVAARAPATFVDENAVLAEVERRREAAQEHIDAIAARIVDGPGVERLDDATQQMLRAFATQKAIEQDPPPRASPPRFPPDPLDPCDPVRDWWSLHVSWYSDWTTEWADQRLPYVEQELRTRIALAALRAATYDRANGLYVFHQTARACEEMLAIALDAAVTRFPAVREHNVRAPGWHGDLLEARWSDIRHDAVPATVGAVVAEILERVECSSSDCREVYLGAERVPWHEAQHLPVERRILRLTFPSHHALGMVSRTTEAVNALHLFATELPDPDALDLTPASAGPYVWSPTEEPWIDTRRAK